MLASDGLVVPVETSPKGLQAVSGVLGLAREYGQVLTKLGVGVEGRFVKGFVPTKYDPRSRVHRESLSAVRTLQSVAPVAPPIAYRPAVHSRAIEVSGPIHRTGSPEAIQEIVGVVEAFLFLQPGVPV